MQGGEGGVLGFRVYVYVQAESAKKLKFDHGLVREGVVELGELAAQAFNSRQGSSNCRPSDARRLARCLELHTRRRPEELATTMSNCEIRDLTFQQIQYAGAENNEWAEPTASYYR